MTEYIDKEDRELKTEIICPLNTSSIIELEEGDRNRTNREGTTIQQNDQSEGSDA